MQLTGKVAAVTGAGSGIGRALAVELAERGCEVALSDVDEDGLQETHDLLRGSAARVSVERVDVRDVEAMRIWAENTRSTHGDIHVIINNAGVGVGSTIAELDLDDLRWIMDINFWGVVHGTTAFLPHLREAGEGRVVNISSVLGLVGAPAMGLYNASKFAVRGLTEALQQELALEGSGVGATVVLPGGVRTRIARSSRISDHLEGRFVENADAGRTAFERLLATPPERAAATILDGVERGAARVLVGPDARVIDLVQRALPVGYQRIGRSMMREMLDPSQAPRWTRLARRCMRLFV